MHKILCLAAFALLALFNSPSFAASLPADEEQQIRTILKMYYDVWNQHEPKKQAELYASDGDLRTVFNEWGKNRSEIEKIFADEQNGIMKNAHVDYEIKSIRMIKPDIAFADVESDIKGIETLDKSKYMPLHHHVVFVLVKREGKWQILIGRPF